MRRRRCALCRRSSSSAERRRADVFDTEKEGSSEECLETTCYKRCSYTLHRRCLRGIVGLTMTPEVLRRTRCITCDCDGKFLSVRSWSGERKWVMHPNRKLRVRRRSAEPPLKNDPSTKGREKRKAVPAATPTGQSSKRAFTMKEIDEPGVAAPLPLATKYPDARIIEDIAKVHDTSSRDFAIALSLNGYRERDEDVDDKRAMEIARMWDSVAAKVTARIPRHARFLLISGISGAGKTQLCNRLRFDDSAGWTAATTATTAAKKLVPSEWPRDRAVVSCFGDDPKVAQRWLSSVALSSIPDWTKPYHVLSTGQKYRAALAHKLWRYYCRAPSSSGEAKRCRALSSRPIVLDDFAAHLDSICAKSCACAVGRRLRDLQRQFGGAAVVATTREDVASYLQPDVVVAFSATTCSVLQNPNAGARPDVKIYLVPRKEARACRKERRREVKDGKTSPPKPRLSSSRVLDTTVGVSMVTKRFETIRVATPDVVSLLTRPLYGLRSTCAGENKNENENDVEILFRGQNMATRGMGGIVLVSTVVKDACTNMCDAYFDTEFNGRCETPLCAFPDPRALWSASPRDANSSEAEIGVICGRSGSAKSALARLHFGEPLNENDALVRWDASTCVTEHFGNERRLLAKGALVGFVATVDHFGWKGPCGTPKTPARRAHRTVVLPSFQGLGIGSCLSDACAELHRREGFLYFGQTVHPRFGRYRDRSPLWKATPWNHRTSTHRVETWKQRLGNVRIKRRNAKFVYSHQYVGEDPEKSGDACSGHARRVVVLKEGEAGPLWHTRTHPP
eukprot:g4592.t1